MTQYLLKVSKDNREETIVLKDNFMVGRDDEMDLFIEDPSVSGRHATIRIIDRRVIVEDFASTNGTFVNGKVVKETQEIRHKDNVAFGNFKCTFIDTHVREVKKYITVCSSVNNVKEHNLKVVISEQKLSLEEVNKARTSSEATLKHDFKIVPVCRSCVYTPGYVHANVLKDSFVTEISVTPLSRKVDKISLLFQRENTVVQNLSTRLNHNKYYAKKCIMLAVIIPVLCFFLDGIAFKTQGLSFITACLLSIVNACGGFTVVGILGGITLTILGLVMNLRSQVIDLYYKELDFEL